VFRIAFRVVDKTARFQSLNFTKLNDFKHFVAILKVTGPSHCTSTLLSKPIEMVMLTTVMVSIYRRKFRNETMIRFCENCVCGKDGKIFDDLDRQNCVCGRDGDNCGGMCWRTC